MAGSGVDCLHYRYQKVFRKISTFGLSFKIYRNGFQGEKKKKNSIKILVFMLVGLLYRL